MSTSSKVFASASKKQDPLQKQNIRLKKYRNRFTIQTAKITIRLLPKQIAESRIEYPGQEWIKIKPVFFWGVWTIDREIDGTAFIEYFKNNGFDIRFTKNNFYIRDPDVL